MLLEVNIDTLKKQIAAVDWSKYETAYGKANDVPDLLMQLISPDDATSLKASHKLWCGLCHQSAYLSSAAEPAYPLLRTVLVAAQGDLLDELLDIFSGFTECSSPYRPDGSGSLQKRIRSMLLEDLDLFRQLAKEEGSEGIASSIIDQLTCHT